MMRRTFQRHIGRIPYVWNPDFNKTLRQYINTAPTRNVMLITGPYQSGKSRALNIMAKDLAVNRRLVINCDLSTAKTPEDVISLFKIAVINGLSSVYPYLSSNQISKASNIFKAEKENEIQSDSNIQNQPNEFTSPTTAQNFTTNSTFSETSIEGTYEKDPFLGLLYVTFSRILHNSLKHPYSFSEFFDYLENQKNYLRPVVFIHRLENLQKSSPSLYSSFLSRLSRRPLYNDFVPIVCEIRDSSFRIDSKPIPSYLSFTDLKPLADPTKDLIVKNSVFSQIELRKIMNSFGGHGGSIERVFEDLKMGLSIDESIKKEQQAVESYIKDLLKGDFPQPLYEICRLNGTAKIVNTTSLKTLVPLFQSGHLYLNRGSIVQVAHNGVRNALCQGYI